MNKRANQVFEMQLKSNTGTSLVLYLNSNGFYFKLNLKNTLQWNFEIKTKSFKMQADINKSLLIKLN